MNPSGCCKKPARRAGGMAGWLLPSATLALLPKCPMCVAAYVALLGISLPVAAAASLRTALLALCVIALFYMAIRYLRRFAKQLHLKPKH